MKLNHCIKISLFDFIKDGAFDFLKLGMTKDEILNIFPAPDESNEKTLEESVFWYYGNTQFMFDKDQLTHLSLVRLGDWFIDMGKHFEIDFWIFNGSQQLTLIHFLEHLNNHGIDYIKYTRPSDKIIQIHIIKSKAKIWFDPIKENSNEAELVYLTWQLD